MCIAQEHNTVTQVRLKPLAPQPQVKHSTTEPLCSLQYRGPGRVFRDTGILAINLKGYRIFLKIFKGKQDAWINFRDMGIQCFLNFGDICHIYFRDKRYFLNN